MFTYSRGTALGWVAKAFGGPLANAGIASFLLEDGLPQDLLSHFMSHTGDDFELTKAQMHECDPTFNLFNNAPTDVIQAVSQYGKTTAKFKVEADAKKSGTLGSFTINFEGMIYIKDDIIILQGKMNFVDIYDFEFHSLKSKRTFMGNLKTGYGSTIDGKPFKVKSEEVDIVETNTKGTAKQVW